MASGIYNKFKAQLFEGKMDLQDDSPSDEIKIALMDNNHSFDATKNMWSQISANELASAGNYTTGGKSLVSQGVTQAGTTKFDAEDLSWLNATFSAYHAVIYNNTDGTLIASIDFGSVKTVAAGTFTIQWNAAGIITLAEA